MGTRTWIPHQNNNNSVQSHPRGGKTTASQAGVLNQTDVIEVNPFRTENSVKAYFIELFKYLVHILFRFIYLSNKLLLSKIEKTLGH